ncbi:MAG: TonB-dependent receptor [Sphingomonadales bacterium]
MRKRLGNERIGFVSHYAIAAAAFGLTAAMAPAMAQDTPQAGAPEVLAPVRAGGEGAERKGEYKVEKPESPKYLAPLLDTPQTVTIVPQQVIRDQNLLTMRDILQTVPGITFGAGEGGGGYGDSINLRGFAANTDITVDGLRDSAQYTRSDPFNLEQLEVINGANSVISGSGSVGGTINLVSKTPKNYDFTTISGGVGTNDYGRITVDANQTVTDTIAIRLNGMWHMNDAPGRRFEKYDRWGVAPSVTFGMGTDTRVTLMYIHQQDDNIPQYGVPYYVTFIDDDGIAGTPSVPYNEGPLDEVDPKDYFGYHNVDRQKIEVNTVTAKIEHDFNDNLSIRNVTRYGEITQYSMVDPPQGTWCLSDGRTPAGVACGFPGFYQPSGPRGTTRFTKNTLLINQTDFTASFDTGGVRHTLVIGAAFTHETYKLENGNSLRNPDGSTVALPLMDISDPDTVWAGPFNFSKTAQQDGRLNNQAVYMFDRMQFTDWLEFNGGIRWEHNSGTHTTGTYSNGAFVSQGPLFENEDNLFSYRAGLVFKPAPNGSIYIAYGNSKTPSKSSVNGACTAITCNVNPESAVNYEVGTKWDLFDARMQLTASLFRNERQNYRVPSTDPTEPDNVLDGKARVNGVTLGASGRITDAWQIFANYTYLYSKVIRNLDKDSTAFDPLAGNPLTQTPKNAFSLWTTYDIGWGITLGYGMTYQSKIYVTNSSSAPGAAVVPLATSPHWWTHRAMISYDVTEDLRLQLNVTNLFDKEYYTRVRNNGWAVPGDGRYATLTVSYTF